MNDVRIDEWLRGGGPEHDVVVSTRVRLARNIEGFSFSPTQDAEEARLLTDTVERALRPLARKMNWSWVDLRQQEPLSRQVLFERHLISREMEEAERARGVLFDERGLASLMVNEEDHVRLQVFRSGLRLREAFEEADQVDDEVSSVLPYAFNGRYGFLTSCPTNTGTGLRISVLMHLPALVAAKEIEKATTAIQEMSMAVRGLYGEGSRAVGDLFQISNQRTLGESEGKILEALESAVRSLLSYERRQREEFQQNPIYLEDRAWRALGVFERARCLSSDEAMDLLSRLRLGRILGLLDQPSIDQLNRIILLAQPGHLQAHVGQRLGPQERDAVRAELVRKVLAQAGPASGDQP
jgi:protein arginine kinase